MKNTIIKSRQINFFFKFIIFLIFISAASFLVLAQDEWESRDEWRNQYKVGDKIEFSISGNASDFQICTVSENSPQAVMRVKCEKFKQWTAGNYIVYGKDYVRLIRNEEDDKQNKNSTKNKRLFGNLKDKARKTVETVKNQTDEIDEENETPNEWSEDTEWRSDYKVGDKIQVTISEKPEDFQTCTVTENDPQSVMRVKCNAFKYWKAGVYIVHSESNLISSKTQSTKENNQNNTRINQNGGASSGLKVGEYACYGSGGRIMVGLGFKVLSGNRFTDLEGGNAGTFVISGDTVKFRGGHLDGQTGRELRNYNFRIGAQASCEPF